MSSTFWLLLAFTADVVVVAAGVCAGAVSVHATSASEDSNGSATDRKIVRMPWDRVVGDTAMESTVGAQQPSDQ
ncbi:hypothetical protein MPRG_27730 [Mycobacterium paragordonae]|uniref:Secreted protein n=1 Tax=Mycobacterium paragordonae TaxID=1389713 RepID=A0ABQ1C4Y4_9MYCO|nr:hypothetical protein MPRG_27730 [Mycobacterium paragordonae]